MAELPNLAGVAPKGLVEKIGTGKYAAAYINWSRTMQLLRENAPGWMVDYVPAGSGALLHEAPVGGYLMIRFRHVDGTLTPALPQAVMDNRNKSIPLDKITSRDITDTQRRGMCMAAAMTFGLAYELWAKMPLESGYQSEEAPAKPQLVTERKDPNSPVALAATPAAPAPATGGTSEATEATFREAALECGIHTEAIDKICSLVEGKGGDWGNGISLLKSKSAEEWNAKYGPKEEAPAEESW